MRPVTEERLVGGGGETCRVSCMNGEQSLQGLYSFGPVLAFSMSHNDTLPAVTVHTFSHEIERTVA